jgi:hypothetical protein
LEIKGAPACTQADGSQSCAASETRVNWQLAPGVFEGTMTPPTPTPARPRRHHNQFRVSTNCPPLHANHPSVCPAERRVRYCGTAKKPAEPPKLFWLTYRHSDGNAAGLVVIESGDLLHAWLKASLAGAHQGLGSPPDTSFTRSAPSERSALAVPPCRLASWPSGTPLLQPALAPGHGHRQNAWHKVGRGSIGRLRRAASASGKISP